MPTDYGTVYNCMHCRTNAPTRHYTDPRGSDTHYCSGCSRVLHPLCPHCNAAGDDRKVALFGTFKFCPICGGALNYAAPAVEAA